MKKIFSSLTAFLFLVTFSALTTLPARADTLWSPSGNNIYNTNSGYVGIGTPNPSAKLDVRGEVALNDYALKFRSGTDAWHTMWFQSGGLFVKENEGLEFQMGLGLNKIKFTSDGNVGIGTLDPDAKLDLVNNPGSTNNLALATNSYPNAYRWRFNTVDRGMAIDLDFTVSNNPY